MFTGIIEAIGTVDQITEEGTNKTFTVTSPISQELKVDQSVSHNGVCLTVTEVVGDRHKVTAIQETLVKSNLGELAVGRSVNLERCMKADGRFDGHIVQGHVDQVGICTKLEAKEGSWLFDFEYDTAPGNITVEKGSITVNGISLTCFNSREGGFSVAIIPYTFEHTNMKDLKEGSSVNLEFDIVGKYLSKLSNTYLK